MSHPEGHQPGPDSDDDDSDLGQAIGGQRYVIDEAAAEGEGEGERDYVASRAEGAQGEPDDGLEGEDPDEDPDKRMAKSLRKAAEKAQRINQQNQSLPFIPANARLHPVKPGGHKKNAAKQSALTPEEQVKARLKRMSCWRRWRLYMRVIVKWQVAKFFLLALLLPVFSGIGFYYWWNMPRDVSFAQALIDGDFTTVNYYLDKERIPLNDVLSGDPQARYPLHLAAVGNRTELVKHLVHRGALLDVHDDNGFTPLHYASNALNMEMADFLLTQGAPVDALDVNGRTPLHIAAITGSVPVLAVLVFNGNADLHVADKDKYLATDYSRLFHSSNMQKLLDGGYYHDHAGEMKVISHEKYEAMKKREGINTEEIDRIRAGGKPTKKTNTKKKKKKQPKKGKRVRDEELQTIESRDQPRHSPDGKLIDDDEDDSFMSLFTGDEPASVAQKRYQRQAEQAQEAMEQQQAAAEDFDALLKAGPVDQDEFEV